MSGGLDNTHGENLTDASLGTAAFVATTTPLKARLMSANGSGSTNGTEVANSGGSTYASQTATFAATNTSFTAVSNAALTFAGMPAVASPGVQGIELWDSAGTPKRKWWGPLAASVITNLGDTVSIASGSLNVVL